MKYNTVFSLKGKTAVVTGGAGLIGKEILRGLTEAGATVILGELDKKKGKRLEKELIKEGLNAVFYPLDITKEKSVDSLISFADKRYGKIDIWINNAYPRTKDWGVLFEKITFDSWRKNVDMHLSGYFICSKKAAEYMKKRKKGSIINFGSIYGMLGPQFSIYKGTNMTVAAPYSAIKGGIINFSKYLASYYGKYNIRVNCISPGGVFDNQKKTFVKNYTEKTLLGRMALPEDIVGGALYLASDASKYVTGHNLVIDGGWSVV